ncbi:hypothetical protein JRO89_XS01G0063300 [Xanthoceras sorbifolium]|uniref:DNA (cytosine-5-)-methyltransferase n=1 Tax=Xanthoceras sorbifolium TaxID=99658 RepID=A0ABQ8IIV5_9ROSI|nr:hypothetical protein JRO89_XS01G0063300 [Xanthoceras sorbifolium]
MDERVKDMRMRIRGDLGEVVESREVHCEWSIGWIMKMKIGEQFLDVVFVENEVVKECRNRKARVLRLKLILKKLLSMLIGIFRFCSESIKGANFRDLPGVIVGIDNVARRDPTKEKMLLPSGKPMVPDYALTFEQGKSKRPFARLWWDETVPTIVTFPGLHSMAVLHPEQDRVLTIRECARLQGFPDYYRFCGTVKER